MPTISLFEVFFFFIQYCILTYSYFYRGTVEYVWDTIDILRFLSMISINSRFV